MQTPYDPQLILKNTERLRYLARTLIRDEHLAEDLVQETWLAALKRPPRHEAALPAWLGRVLRNRAVSHRRSDEARRERELKRAPAEADAARPVEALERFEVLKTLVELVWELEEPDRSTVILHFFEGRNLREVARRQDASYSSVRLRVNQALERLRIRLDGRLGNRGAWVLALVSLLAGRELVAVSGAASAPAPGVPVSKILGGMVSMSTKKVTLSIALSLATLLGIVAYWGVARRPRVEVEAPAAATASAGGARAAVDGRRGEGPADGTGGPAARVENGAALEALPPSILGRVTSGGSAVGSARVIALPLARWTAVAAIGSGETDLEKRLSRVSEAYRAEAARSAEVRTRADGGFVFRGLSGGEYRLIVSHPEHLPSAETIAAVGEGNRGSYGVELVPAAGIDGQVVDEEGRPVAGARIEAEPHSVAVLRGQQRDLKRLLDWEEGLAILDGARADSGAGGAFRLNGLSPAVHALRTRHEAFLEADVLMVQPGTPARVVLRRGVVITGRVLDPEMRPIAGADVSLRQLAVNEVHRMFDWTGSEREDQDLSARKTKTGSDGRFQLEGLPPARHELSVAAPSSKPSSKPSSAAPLFREVETQDKGVDLGVLVLSRPLSISGRVLQPAGRPAAGARVWAGRQPVTVRPGKQIGSELPRPLVEARSGDGGAFALEGLPAGSYYVRAEADGLAEAVVTNAAAGEDDLKLVLGAGITIHGRVVDAETRKPVAGADVKVGIREMKSARSEADGSFILRALSPESVYYHVSSVRASHPDYGPYSAHNVVVIGRDERSPLEIGLVRSGFEIEGRVVDAQDQPIAGAVVWAQSAGDDSGYTSLEDRTSTDAGGAFKLAEPSWLRFNASMVKVVVVASHPAYASSRVGPLELPGTGERWPFLKMVLAAGSALEGKVADEAGAPIAGARITARRTDDAGPGRAGPNRAPLGARTAYSAKDGTYRLTGLEAGPSEVTAAALGYAPETVSPLDIAPDRMSRDFVLGRGASIAGRVVDSERTPVAGAEVTALPDSAEADPDDFEFRRRLEQRIRSGVVSARTSEDGRYELAHLPHGRYTVVARASGFEASQARGVSAGEQAPDLALARFSAVRGKAAAADTGAPLPAFTVNAIDKARRSANGGDADWRIGSQGELTYNDPLGRFIYDGLRPGEYELIFEAPGFLSFHADVKLKAGEELELEARLRQGARIEGAVLDAVTGRPVARAHVTCTRQIPREEWEASRKPGRPAGPPMPPASGMGDTLTREDGSFAIEGLLDGEYLIMVRHPLYAGPGVKTLLGPAGAARVEVRLQPTGRLEGLISGLRKAQDGQLLQQSLEFKRLTPEGDDGYKSDDEWGVGVDAGGRFQAQGLSPGLYRLILRQREYRWGKFTETGAGSGRRDPQPVGPEKTIPLGEVEIQAGRTVFFQGKAL